MPATVFSRPRDQPRARSRVFVCGERAPGLHHQDPIDRRHELQCERECGTGSAYGDGANVAKACILTSNGVIHVIDAVLLPPE